MPDWSRRGRVKALLREIHKFKINLQDYSNFTMAEGARLTAQGSRETLFVEVLETFGFVELLGLLGLISSGGDLKSMSF